MRINLADHCFDLFGFHYWSSSLMLLCQTFPQIDSKIFAILQRFDQLAQLSCFSLAVNRYGQEHKFSYAFIPAHRIRRIAVFKHPGDAILDAEFAAVRILGLRVVDQELGNIVDQKLDFFHIFRFQAVFGTQHLHCVQGSVGRFAAGIRFKRIIVNLIYTIIQTIRQFFQMRFSNHCSAKQ